MDRLKGFKLVEVTPGKLELREMKVVGTGGRLEVQKGCNESRCWCSVYFSYFQNIIKNR